MPPKTVASCLAACGSLALRNLLLMACVLYYCSLGETDKRIVKPNLTTHECLRRAHYARNPERFACKDLGLCYKFYCEQVARRCNTCKPSTVVATPCLQYEKRDAGSNNTTPKPRQKFVTIDAELFETSAAPLPVDLPRKVLLRLTAGGKDCSAFLVGLPFQKRVSHVVVTAAQCLIDFRVECTAPNEYGNETLAKTDNHACFGYRNWQVQRVEKGFRSYCVTLRHNDHSTQIALHSKNVMVARQYLECEDCRYDLAAIRITARHYEELNISLADAHTAAARPKARLANLTATVASFLESNSKFADRVFVAEGAVSSVQKMKFCVALSNTTDRVANNFLPGSPVTVAGDDGTLETVGIATHLVRAQMQMDLHDEKKKQEAPSGNGMTSVPLVSVVRLTKSFMNFVGRWLMGTRDRGPCALGLHPRFDCFPTYPKAQANQSMCMCARGWTNERNSCRNAMEVMTEKCSWNAKQRNAKCDGTGHIKGSKRRKRSIEMGVIPGSAAKLSLVYNNVTSSVEVEELLRHLTDLRSLVLDCNRLEKAMWKTFQYGRKLQYISLRRNNLTWLHTGAFRRNRRLLSLCLANNSLSTFSKKHFAKLVNLVDLDLSGNLISEMPEKAFRKLRSLERLSLGGNLLRKLHRDIFRNNRKLKEIWLEDNMLDKLSPGLFASCPDLRMVNLEGNLLTGLPAGLFAANPLLHRLNLNNNHLRALPSDLLDHQNHIDRVTMYNNTRLPQVFTLSEFSSATVNNLKRFLDQYG